MNTTALNIGFIPLVDAAPLVVAQELGFAGEEGLALNLMKAPSWSALRDMVTLGRAEAAHMLAPIPVAIALGLGGPVPLDVLSVMSVNGTVLGVCEALARRMRADGFGFDFADAAGAGKALIAASNGPLRIGVPFPFSMHAELLYYWLSALGLPAPENVQIHTVPPPLMAEAIAAGEIDAFSVGEPWGSIAVENGVGALLLPGAAIWKFAPEKVLAARRDWAEARPNLAARLIRAVWRAGRWLDNPDNHLTAAEIMARPAYLNVGAEVIERALTGHLVISGRGEQRVTPNFLAFHKGAAQFPWRSQGAWIAGQLAARTGLARPGAEAAGANVMRSDLYRAALAGEGADLPGASAKLEGSLEQRTAVASDSGKLFLEPDGFFNGRHFDLSEGE
ncbi:MAG: CmpA/NrtA family ABC transporter substrate-binding protein [Maritimibacter sp.]